MSCAAYEGDALGGGLTRVTIALRGRRRCALSQLRSRCGCGGGDGSNAPDAEAAAMCAPHGSSGAGCGVANCPGRQQQPPP